METDRTTATTANKLSRMVPSSGWHQQQEGSRRGRQQLGAPAEEQEAEGGRASALMGWQRQQAIQTELDTVINTLIHEVTTLRSRSQPQLQHGQHYGCVSI